MRTRVWSGVGPKSEPTHPVRWYVQKNRVVSRELSSGGLVKSLVLSDRTRVGKRLTLVATRNTRVFECLPYALGGGPGSPSARGFERGLRVISHVSLNHHFVP